MKIISKKEAQEKGLRKYFTGAPCKRGHLSYRFIGNGGCCECKRIRDKAPEIKSKKKIWDKEYRTKNKDKCNKISLEWARKNPEKRKEIQKKYAKNNRDKVCESRRKTYLKHRNKKLEYSRKWSEENKDKRREYARRYVEKHRQKALESKKLCSKKWRENNPEEAKRRSKAFYIENKEKIKKKVREYYINNPDKIKAYSKRYALENRDKINKRHKDRYKSDPDYKAARIIRSVLRKQIERVGVKKSGRTNETLMYSTQSLKARLEFQFKDGMSWDNYGEWHVDHKKPVSRFIKQGNKNPRIINSLSNLQPLWAEDNLKKSDKWIY